MRLVLIRSIKPLLLTGAQILQPYMRSAGLGRGEHQISAIPSDGPKLFERHLVRQSLQCVTSGPAFICIDRHTPEISAPGEAGKHDSAAWQKMWVILKVAPGGEPPWGSLAMPQVWGEVQGPNVDGVTGPGGEEDVVSNPLHGARGISAAIIKKPGSPGRVEVETLLFARRYGRRGRRPTNRNFPSWI
jgi:hypothetical protein